MAKLLSFVLVVLAACGVAQAAIVGKEVTYKDGNTTLKGYIAYDDAVKGKRPGILVVHEWWGPTEFVKDYARAFAAKGYTALAIDMYGKTAADGKEAAGLMDSVMGQPLVMRSRFAAARKVLASHPTTDATRIGAVGFSMGSSVILNMARAGEDLAGVVSVYGGLETTTPARPGAVKGRVLVLHANGDQFVKPESVEGFASEMKAAKVDYRFVNYSGVKHGFANPDATANGKKFDMPIAYDAETDRKARAEMFAFFAETFAKR
jgi:dienelactone hydrolase